MKKSILCKLGFHKWRPTTLVKYLINYENFKCIRFGCNKKIKNYNKKIKIKK
jgi:hypothetical protein